MIANDKILPIDSYCQNSALIVVNTTKQFMSLDQMFQQLPKNIPVKPREKALTISTMESVSESIVAGAAKPKKNVRNTKKKSSKTYCMQFYRFCIKSSRKYLRLRYSICIILILVYTL